MSGVVGCRADHAAATESLSSAVLNGVPLPATDFPVGEFYETDPPNPDGTYTFLVGSGVVIDPNTVLTSADTVANSLPNQVFIINGQSYSITNKVIHPAWVTGSTSSVNLAVVRVAGPIPGITPAPLALAEDAPGTALTVVGYGRDGDPDASNQGLGTALRGGPATLQSYSTASGNGYSYPNGLINLAPGYQGSIPCGGDQGGGAFVGNTLVGEVSVFAADCSAGGIGGTLVSIAEFVPWIQSTMAAMVPPPPFELTSGVYLGSGAVPTQVIDNWPTMTVSDTESGIHGYNCSGDTCIQSTGSTVWTITSPTTFTSTAMPGVIFTLAPSSSAPTPIFELASGSYGYSGGVDVAQVTDHWPIISAVDSSVGPYAVTFNCVGNTCTQSNFPTTWTITSPTSFISTTLPWAPFLLSGSAPPPAFVLANGYYSAAGAGVEATVTWPAMTVSNQPGVDGPITYTCSGNNLCFEGGYMGIWTITSPTTFTGSTLPGDVFMLQSGAPPAGVFELASGSYSSAGVAVTQVTDNWPTLTVSDSATGTHTYSCSGNTCTQADSWAVWTVTSPTTFTSTTFPGQVFTR